LFVDVHQFKVTVGDWGISRRGWGAEYWDADCVSVSNPAVYLIRLGNDFQELEGTLTRLDDVVQNPIDPLRSTSLPICLTSDELSQISSDRTASSSRNSKALVES
jgi:hypothetical protein